MNLLDWQKEAQALLDNKEAQIPPSQRIILERQSRGVCVRCGNGGVANMSAADDRSVIIFTCGHKLKGVSILEHVKARDSIRALVFPQGKGKRNFFFELVHGWFKSVSTQLPQGVYKERVIDKRNDIYKEKVVDAADSANVKKNQSERLSDHRGHGSAKFK